MSSSPPATAHPPSCRLRPWLPVPLCRHPADGLASLANPIGSPQDKLLVGLFRLKSLLGSVDELLKAPETSIEQRLQVWCRS